MDIGILVSPVIISILVISLVLIGVSFLGVFFNRPHSETIYEGKEPTGHQYKYGPKQFFMTRAENSFYKGLREAVKDAYVIFAQVHLPTVVDEKIVGQDWRAARSKIDRKSVDFILCDPDYLNPRLAIELDDSTHEKEDRRERDELVENVLKMAKLPLLRIRYQDNISTEELTEKIRQILK